MCEKLCLQLRHFNYIKTIYATAKDITKGILSGVTLTWLGPCNSVGCILFQTLEATNKMATDKGLRIYIDRGKNYLSMVYTRLVYTSRLT